MKRLLILLTVSGILANAYADTIPGGDVSGTWTTAGSPYIITGDIRVQYEQVLQIEPGVVVKFHGNTGLLVQWANLIAVGTEEDSILFTSADTNGFISGTGDEGGWKGITFNEGSSSADSSRLQHCRFEFGKSQFPNGNIIRIDRHPRLVISNCEFINNRPSNTIISCYLADPVIGLAPYNSDNLIFNFNISHFSS